MGVGRKNGYSQKIYCASIVGNKRRCSIVQLHNVHLVGFVVNVNCVSFQEYRSRQAGMLGNDAIRDLDVGCGCQPCGHEDRPFKIMIGEFRQLRELFGRHLIYGTRKKQ